METNNDFLESLAAGLPALASQGLRAVNVQTYVESNVKLGNQHEFSVYDPALAFDGFNDFVLLTGAQPVALKGRVIRCNGAGVVSSVFQGPTYSGGVAQPYFNLNYKNPVAGLAQIIGGATVSDVGVKVAADKHVIGAASQGNQVTISEGREAEGLEFIFAPNTAYLFRLASLGQSGTQRVSAYVTWYEGVLDLPL